MTIVVMTVLIITVLIRAILTILNTRVTFLITHFTYN
jgi:hypothetical protein